MNGIKKTEEYLNMFTRKPPPTGLRTKVLEAAARKREAARWLSPALLKAALTAGVIGAAFLVLDAGLEGSQKKRLASLAGLSRNIPQEESYQDFLLEEFVAWESNASWAIFRLKIMNQARQKEALETKKHLLRREIDEY